MFSSHKRSIGLDIADHTIEVVELERQGKDIRVVSKARAALPVGVVEHGQVKQPDRLAEILHGLFASAQPTPLSKAPIIFGLPESQVYTHTFRFSDLSQKQIDEVLPKTVVSVIPIAKEKLVSMSLVTFTKDKQTDVVVIATHRDMLHEWEDFFVTHGFSVAAVDSETLASFRDLFPAPVTQPVCVVDIGAMTTFVSLFDVHGLRHTRTVFLAGEDFTQTIASTAHIEYEQAEEEKKTFGLGTTAGEKQWFPALMLQVDTVVKAIHETISFFEKTRNEKVSDVVVIGGSAQLPGLVQYIQEKSGYPTRIGQSICSGTPLEYIEAVGLAKFSLEAERWKRHDPIFTFSKKTNHSAGVPVLSRRIVVLAIAILSLCSIGLLGYLGYRQFRPSRQTPVAAVVVPEVAPSSTPEVFFRVVNNDGQFVPIYEQATTTGPVVTEAEPGEEFLILGTSSGGLFTRIQVDTLEGWIESTQGEEVAQEE